MFNWMTAPASERRLLPGGRMQGPTPYVIAIMMFVTIIVAATGLARQGPRQDFGLTSTSTALPRSRAALGCATTLCN